MWAGIVALVILALATCLVAYIENQDWKCPTLFPDEEQRCTGEGMPFRGGVPQPDDDCATLIKRIVRSAGAMRKSVKWRQSFILASLVTFATFALVVTPGRLDPDMWVGVYCMFCITFLILNFSSNWHSFHRYEIPERHIHTAIEMLQQKGCIGKEAFTHLDYLGECEL